MKHTASANGNSRSSTARAKRIRAGGFVVCIDNRGYEASLELLKLYRVLPATGLPPGELRVEDESGEDYVYSERRFAAITVPPRVRRISVKAQQHGPPARE